jgi:plasmid stabilization system protein ParE
MARAIIYSTRALHQIREAFNYLFENFGKQASENFLIQIEKKEGILLNYPESGKRSNTHDKIRYVLIDKHRRLYYRFNSKSIYVMAFFDTRQNPNKRPF